MSSAPRSRLTLGPLLFHWPAKKRRDFYLEVADESPVDTVYLGEVVCTKREPVFASHRDEVIRRLRAAGKEVVLSTLALVTTPAEVEAIRAAVDAGLPVEANDVACLRILGGRPHVIGPYINVFNEGARQFLTAHGATRIVLPVEVPYRSMPAITAGAAGVEFEVQVFGRQPLSVAMRCYHARANDLHKDHCQLVCGVDADGLRADTIDGQPILTVNGTQTLTVGHAVLLTEIELLRTAGVTHFRLSPHDLPMTRIARLYRDVSDGRQSADEALAALRPLTGATPYLNGFFHGTEGRAWVAQ